MEYQKRLEAAFPNRMAGLNAQQPQQVAPATAQPVNKGGSQFTDVSRYLTQNKPGAQRLASQVGQQVVGAGNEARAGIGTATQNFNSQVAANEVVPNQAVLGKVAAQPGPKAPAAPVVAAPAGKIKNNKGVGNSKKNNNQIIKMLSSQSAPKAPAAAPGGAILSAAPPLDPATTAQFDAMKNAQPYAGPTDLSQAKGYGDATAGINKAQDIATQAGTGAGRQDLLQGMYGKQRSGGVSALDNTLIGRQNPLLGSAVSGNQALGGDLDNASRIASARAGMAQQNNLASAQGAKNALASQIPTMSPAQPSVLSNPKGSGNANKKKMEALQKLLAQQGG